MCCIPAMLATYLMLPSPAASSTASSRSLSEQRSVLIKTIRPPMSRAIFCVSRPPSSLISRPTVMRLLAAAATAVALPIPPAAPVTIQTFPVLKLSSSKKRISSFLISGSLISIFLLLPFDNLDGGSPFVSMACLVLYNLYSRLCIQDSVFKTLYSRYGTVHFFVSVYSP